MQSVSPTLIRVSVFAPAGLNATSLIQYWVFWPVALRPKTTPHPATPWNVSCPKLTPHGKKPHPPMFLVPLHEQPRPPFVFCAVHVPFHWLHKLHVPLAALAIITSQQYGRPARPSHTAVMDE